MKIRRALLLFGGGIKRLLNLANLFSFEADHTTPTAGVLPVYKPYGGLGDFTVVRGSSATYVDSVGIIKESLYNVARIDYTNGVAELLTEPQSTNLITYSEDFTLGTNWFAQGGATTIQNVVTSPDGNLTADSINLIADANSMIYRFSTLSAGEHTLSIWVRSDVGGETFTMTQYSPTAGQINSDQFTVSNEWQKFEWTFTAVGGESTNYYPMRNGEAIIKDFYIWGAQLEELPYATSYIKTSGSTVTRLQDQITDGGNVNVINSEEGTMFFEGGNIDESVSESSVSIVLDANNRVTIQYLTPSIISAVVRLGSVNEFVFSETVSDVKDNVKVAIKWKVNDMALWINGVEITTDLTANTFVANLLQKVEFSSGGTFRPFFGRTRELKVYNKALPDSQLEYITTL